MRGLAGELMGYAALHPSYGTARSLSDLKVIGRKSAWPVHISPIFWSIEQLLTCKIGKICPRPGEFSLRFFKSDRLLGRLNHKFNFHCFIRELNAGIRASKHAGVK